MIPAAMNAFLKINSYHNEHFNPISFNLKQECYNILQMLEKCVQMLLMQKVLFEYWFIYIRYSNTIE